MDYATLEREVIKREDIINRLGGVEIPWGHVAALDWEDISKDCLPIIVYRSKDPEAKVCANRMQLDAIRKDNPPILRECYIVEIPRIMKHSNLKYCEDLIELDRKFKHKRKKILSNQKKLMMKDIVENLNRSKSAADIAAAHGTSAFNVTLMATKLRKQYNFNIPGARGNGEFAMFAAEIAKERPELINKPLAKTTSNGHRPLILSRGGRG